MQRSVCTLVEREIMYNKDYVKYDKLVPRSWFWTTWNSFVRPQTAPGNDYFVTLGDSFSCGYAMTHYKETWVQKLSDNTGIGHVNLSWNGASIEATCRFLDRSLKIDNSKLHIVMLPYPWRAESRCIWKGERFRRIKDSHISLDECATKIVNVVHKYENERVVFSNGWGFMNELKDQLRKIQSKKFMLNDQEWLDRALDGPQGHAGPKTHDVFARQIQEFIKDK